MGQLLPEPVPQRTGQGKIALDGAFVHLYVPFLTTAIGTSPGDASETVII
jgi:hypothetical protein